MKKTLPVFGMISSFIIVCVIIGLVCLLLPRYQEAKIRAINELNPNSFHDLVLLGAQQKSLDPRRIKAFYRYFETLNRLQPQRADAVAMRGFCAYHLGDLNRAIVAYEQAVAMMPQFFAFHYNLAVLYFKTSQYAKSVEQLQVVLESDIKASLLYVLSSSKIYALMLLAKTELLNLSVEDQFKVGYQKSFELMMMTQMKMQTQQSLPGEKTLELQSF